MQLDNLKYGIIYVYGNPKTTHNLQWFTSMIEPMIRPLSVEWHETWDIGQTIIAARRFNVGNIGKYATVQLHLNLPGRSDSFSLLAGIHAFSDCLQDVMDDNEGDVIFHESNFRDRNQKPDSKWGSSMSSSSMQSVLREYGMEAVPQDHTRVEFPPHPSPLEAPQPMLSEDKEDYGNEDDQSSSEGRKSLNDRIKALRNKFKKSREVEFEKTLEERHERPKFQQNPDAIPEEADTLVFNAEYQSDDMCLGAPDEPIDVESEEIVEFKRINSEYERDVKDLRARIVAFIAKYHQDPQQVMTTMLEGKVLLGRDPGHILVNGDLKIVLPDYDEMEIKMPAMCRTIYILFLMRQLQGQDGIVLKDIGQYRDEIIDIYGLVKPGANEQRVMESVNNLCDPMGESLNQTISRINRCIKNVITDKELSRQYSITGVKGGEYGIALSPQLISIPRALTNA